MKTIINVDNIRCGGCANTITKTIQTIAGVESVGVDIASGTITIEHSESLTRQVIAAKLLDRGYPEKGTTSGMDSIKAGAKSLVSCAIGKLDKSTNQK